jgi:hypothetical protein
VDPLKPGDGLDAAEPGDGLHAAEPGAGLHATLPGDRHLEAALRALAREDAALRPAPDVEARLRARVQALRHRSGRGRTATAASWRTTTWQTAAAAAAGILFVLIWRFVPSQAPARLAVQPAPAPAFTAEFLPLPYAHVPVARGNIVRMPVPRAALAAFGLDPGRAGDTGTVLADVFVGEDGIARSVRFVDPAIQEDSVQ